MMQGSLNKQRRHEGFAARLEAMKSGWRALQNRKPKRRPKGFSARKAAIKPLATETQRTATMSRLHLDEEWEKSTPEQTPGWARSSVMESLANMPFMPPMGHKWRHQSRRSKNHEHTIAPSVMMMSSQPDRYAV